MSVAEIVIINLVLFVVTVVLSLGCVTTVRYLLKEWPLDWEVPVMGLEHMKRASATYIAMTGF